MGVRVPVPEACCLRMPRIPERALFTVRVSIRERTISGILLQRRMPDGTLRFVCTNELGVVYFDLGFGAAGQVTIHAALDGIPRKALLGELARDIRMVWQIGTHPGALAAWDSGAGWILGQSRGHERYLYHYAVDCESWVRCERLRTGRSQSSASRSLDPTGYLTGLHLENERIGLTLELKRYDDSQ